MSKYKSKYYIEDDSRESINDDISSGSDQADGDVIRCICDDTSDDGFTIQCEKCEDWQHASCVNIKKNKIPDHYICERCIKKQKRIANDTRRHSTLDIDLHEKKKKKILKRKKRVYSEESDENEEHDSPPKISRKKFTPLSKSVFKEKLVEDLLIEVHRQWIELNRPKAALGKTETKVTNKGLESIVVMESNLLLPAIPKASVRPIRKSLRGAYFQNQKDPSVEKGVFADIHIPEHRYLMEVTGELLRKSEYKNNLENKFPLLGTPLAHIFFYRSIDICIDARYAGNDTRYIRRSCCPNSEIKSIILPNDNDDQTVHMGIYTSEEVDRGEEITIGWNWHRGLLMWHKNKEFLRKNYSVDIDASERKTLKKTLRLLMEEFGECACEDKDKCLIECIKDELEKVEDDIETSGLTTKKKRIASGKPRKTETKQTRPNTIFSSDEESGSRRSSLKEEKPVQHINKHTTKKKSTPIPSSPAVSVTESVDIDIMSMSPAPSEGEEPHFPGLKRVRPLSTSDIQLPCKKKWLREYMSQQQQLKAKLAQTKITKAPDIEHEEEIDVDGELSDLASSESTLPLDDTRSASHDEPVAVKVDNEDTVQSIGAEITQPEQTQQAQAPNPHKDVQPDVSIPTQEDVKQPLEPAAKDEELQPQHSIEPSSKVEEGPSVTEHEQPSIKAEDIKPAPRKLTLQEYLLMRRGHLPTPDEKPPAE